MGLKYLELTLEEPEAPADSEGDYSEEESSKFWHSPWSRFQCDRICIRERVTAGTPVHVVFHYYGTLLLLAAALCPCPLSML